MSRPPFPCHGCNYLHIDKATAIEHNLRCVLGPPTLSPFACDPNFRTRHSVQGSDSFPPVTSSHY
jgi:hypothetical protein